MPVSPSIFFMKTVRIPKRLLIKEKESLSILHLFPSRKTMMQYFVQNTEIIIERLKQEEHITIPILRSMKKN